MSSSESSDLSTSSSYESHNHIVINVHDDTNKTQMVQKSYTDAIALQEEHGGEIIQTEVDGLWYHVPQGHKLLEFRTGAGKKVVVFNKNQSCAWMKIPVVKRDAMGDTYVGSNEECYSGCIIVWVGIIVLLTIMFLSVFLT